MDIKDNYRDYINSLEKDELVKLILGDDLNPPVFLNNEQLFNRNQINWAIYKINKNVNKADEYTEEIISAIKGHKNDFIYKYDYVRFDLRKPNSLIFFTLIISGLFFIVYIVFKLLMLLLK